ncbi:ATP-binding protein [Formosa haliotis]|uniref:ATP-binding protein n=1 Tax=Formosa haliotis TaxID=1555194 RepID=UPI00082606D0|nr:ATP-binding protein [Formosa haliotis]
MNHFKISDKDENIISQNLENDCVNCFANCNSSGKLFSECPIYNQNRRQGKIINNKGTTFLCCGTTKTTKLFKEKLEALSYAYYDLIIPREQIISEIKKSEQKKVNRLVHNLTSINAHNIQEIYDLIPQDVLASNWRTQVEFIEKELVSKSNKASMMFLRIAKHNIHMKSEFSIYRKLDRDDNANLEFKGYPIRIVLLNVLHTFFGDFTSKNVYVNVSDYYGKVLIDYETIQVALYHLIENSSKYTKTDSTIYIDFKEDNDNVIISMEMISLYIPESERKKIFQEGFSGTSAKKLGKSGDGIGMWRIKQMVELNKGEIEINFGNTIENYRGIDFSKNIFNFKLKKYLP